jgi:AraC family transcriptional activator of pobA
MQRIKQYEGLYGEANNRPPGDYLFSERVETRSAQFDWVIQPHIHARLFQLFFIQSGTFDLQEAVGKRKLAGPCLLLIPPTALHGLVYETGVSGRILTLSDTLVNTLFSDNSPITSMFNALQYLSMVGKAHTVDRIEQLMGSIDEEVFDRQPERQLMLHACLQQLFLVIYRQWQQNQTPASKLNTPAMEYFRRFQRRVRQVGTTHDITQLADELAITPVHLNRICRTVAGKSASQLVQEHIMGEATKLLQYTTYSVSEIAYLLHFDYPNYFARFFRRHAGLSPTEFREKLNAA